MPALLRRAWIKTGIRLCLILLAALFVGLLVHHVWAVLAISSVCILTWQYWNLRRILMRLTTRKHWQLPKHEKGLWKSLERLLYERQIEARQSKRKLLRMLHAYRAAATALPDAIIVLERNSQRVQWFNQAATTLLGLQHPRDLNKPLIDYLYPLPAAQWLAAGRHAEPILDTPSPVDANIRLSLRLIPYSDDYWLLLARDVSKLLHLENVRRDFVANVSHELRTPLTVLHGYLDILDQEDCPEIWPMIIEMQKQSHRMAQLLEDLLTLSRLESQDQTQFEEVNMQSLLTNLKREAEGLSQGQHTIEIHHNAKNNLFGCVKQLHSAFSNLLSNAVRYTPAGGKIVLRSYQTDYEWVVEVEDSGYGIPESHIPRLTERFYRVSSSRTRETGGTGLGLSIVKHILSLHHARLEVKSKVGVGSTFSCYFPKSNSIE